MTEKEKRMFISEVASAMICIKHYPTAEDNKTLGRALDPRANGTWLSKLTK